MEHNPLYIQEEQEVPHLITEMPFVLVTDKYWIQINDNSTKVLACCSSNVGDVSFECDTEIKSCLMNMQAFSDNDWYNWSRLKGGSATLTH